jgi:fatty-acid desaturase
MKTRDFPYIALALGLFLLLVVLRGSQLGNNGLTQLPLLTLLVVSEFSFFVNAIGAYIGFNQIRTTEFQARYALATILCGALSLYFMWLGIQLWPL